MLILWWLRYVYDENGVNITLQAVGAVIRDSFNDLGSNGVEIQNQSGETVSSQHCFSVICSHMSS